MARMILFFALFLALLVGCAPPVAPATPGRFESVLHADVATPPELRAALLDGARHLREVSGGRIQIDIAFDVDFYDMENLQKHVNRYNAMVLHIDSDTRLVRGLDRLYGRVLGALVTGEWGAKRVVLVRDRLQDEASLRAVTLHELGHFAGLPHIESRGSVMSRGRPLVGRFTEEDLASCRSVGLCP